MTYEESSQLMTDQIFRGRIKVAILKYSTYIHNEPPSVQGHSSRYRWAQKVALQSDQEAAVVQPMVVMDGTVQTEGAAISDANLQSSVEIVVNKFL